jgi:hypothetical protein
LVRLCFGRRERDSFIFVFGLICGLLDWIAGEAVQPQEISGKGPDEEKYPDAQ